MGRQLAYLRQRGYDWTVEWEEVHATLIRGAIRDPNVSRLFEGRQYRRVRDFIVRHWVSAYYTIIDGKGCHEDEICCIKQ